MKDSLPQSVPDVIYSNSLSEVSKQLRIENKKGRIFMMLLNPILGKLFSNGKYVIHRNQRLTSENLNNNTLIKSMLQKDFDYQVTKTDYEVAHIFG